MAASVRPCHWANYAPLEFSQGLPRSNLRKLSGFMSVLRGIGN
jgi:hypothetical protein